MTNMINMINLNALDFGNRNKLDGSITTKNTNQHCSIYLFCFLWNMPWSSLIGSNGCDRFQWIDGNRWSYNESAICGGVTISGNLVVVSMILS